MKSNNVEEKGVDFKNLFIQLLKKWKFILLISLMFTCVATIYSLYSSKASLQAEVVEQQVFTEQEEERIQLYIKSEEKYKEIVSYVESSPLMKLDSADYYEANVSFAIVNAEDSVSENELYIRAYQKMLDSNEFYTGLSNVMGGTSIKELAEVVCFQDLEDELMNVKATVENNLLSVNVYFASEQDAETVCGYVQQFVVSKEAELNAKMGVHKLVLIGQSVKNESSNQLLTYQQTWLKNLDTAYTNLDTLKKTMTDQQLQKIEAEEDGVEQDVEPLKKASISKTVVAVGLLAGLLLSVVVVVLGYLLNGKVLSETDTEYEFGIRKLGCVCAKAKNKKSIAFIDNMISQAYKKANHIEDLEISLPIIATQIELACQKNTDNKIVAIANSGNNACTDVLNELKKMLDAKNIQLTICGELTSDINNMVSANSVGKVFLAVENNKVQLDKIRYEVELCRNSEIDVVGMMIVS